MQFCFTQGARNIYTKEDIFSEFIEQPKRSLTGKKTILIFHCEFSSKRGPDMWVRELNGIVIFPNRDTIWLVLKSTYTNLLQ